jgi:probable phosphoglycerate mutase
VHEIWLVRHGATEWSQNGRHTGTTDLPLLESGRVGAARLAPTLAREAFARVLTSPLGRARDTAALAGFPDADVEPDLIEWNYGELEGLTRDEIRERFADWTVWRGPIPGGESVADVVARLTRLLARLDAADGPVLCFAHGHILRALMLVALGIDMDSGDAFGLDPATVSVLGVERGARLLERWNLPPD